MKISIITVSYNSGLTIRDTIESVLSQTYDDLEYIIVDGASTDDTSLIVKEYLERVACFISEPDAGLYDAMNKGIEKATGDVIGFLNSDDIYSDDSVLSSVANFFSSKPNIDLIFGDVVFVKSNNLNIITRYYSASHFKPWKLRFGWMPPHPATFIKKSAYQKVGGYSLGYKISADYEMFVRMLLVVRLGIARLDKVLVRMRVGGVSSAGIKSNVLLNREIVKACRSNGIYTNIFMVLSKTPFKLLEFVRRPLK